MSVYLFRDWQRDLDNMIRPSQLMDQHFGLGLTPEELLAPFTIPQRMQLHSNYCRPWRVTRQNKDSGSVLKCDKVQFQVYLDVQQFTPEEIQVKVVDNSIIVEGKHVAKQDEHGTISRHFVRKYTPEGCDLQAVTSSLSSDGILSITAPKTSEEENKERVIPITHTGPHKSIKESTENKEKSEEK